MIIDAPSGAGLRLRGAISVSLVALVWALAAGVVGLSQLSNLVAAVVVLTSLAITAAIIDLGVRTRRSSPARQAPELPTGWQRTIQRTAIVVAAGIVVAITVFILIDQPGMITPSICLLTGAGLYPLAAVFDHREFRATSIALVILALAGYLFVAALGPAAGQCVVGLGAALALWGTAVLLIRHG